MRDNINFHVFLEEMRKAQGVSLARVCHGLYTRAMMKRIECGKRLPEKQMRDRIMARLGVSTDKYQDYLAIDEYEQWLLRSKIVNSIEGRNICEAEKQLGLYRKYSGQNTVEEQYCVVMELLLSQLKNEPRAAQQELIACAVRLTMPDIEKGLSEKVLLSEQELNLLVEYVYLHGEAEEGEAEWKCRKYQEILNYMDCRKVDDYYKVKVYPRAVYYLGRIILCQFRTEEALKYGIEICNRAIELLRDSSRLYYFVELVGLLEKMTEACGMEQADLAEKISWRDVFMELYATHHVSPYMETFCYLYREMESYCIGDVIRTRRRMLGMTREELCEGICSISTMTRLELKRVKTQMPIVRQLFERLGLCAEYIRSRVISTDYEVMQLAEKFVWYENNHRIKEWLWAYKELEQKLCMEIPQNKQFLMHSHYLIELELGKITDEEYVERLKELVEYTIPLECVMKPGKRFLSFEEDTLIRSMGLHVGISEKNMYIDVIKEICEQNRQEHGLQMALHTYEFLLMPVISYLGNIGEYDKSDKVSNDFERESLVDRRAYALSDTMYNNLWNAREKQMDLKIISKIDRAELEKCILLSRFNKRERLTQFYENEMEKN